MTTITFISIVDGIAGIEDGAGRGDACDLDATLTAYVDEVKVELGKEFPGVVVSYRWENSNQGAHIDLEGDYDFEDYDDLHAVVHGVLEDVYERGTFWVPAED